MCRSTERFSLKIVAALVLAIPLPVAAQDRLPAVDGEQNQEHGSRLLEGLDDLGGLRNSFGLGGPKSGKELTLSAHFTVAEGGRSGVLFVTAEMAQGWHVYSVTQPPGGPMRTRIKLSPADSYQIDSPFKPDRPPIVHPPDVFPVPAEEHHGRVTWSAPLRFAAGVEPKKIKIEGAVEGQVCKEVCIQLNETFAAALVTESPKTEPRSALASVGLFTSSSGNVTIRGHVEPKVAPPGSVATLVLAIEPAPDWHVYAHQDVDPKRGSKPTLIVLDNTSGLAPTRPTTKAPIHEAPPAIEGDPPQRYYEGPVTWTIALPVGRDVAPGSYDISGVIGYQICTAISCDPPRALRFDVQLLVGSETASGQLPLALTPTKYGEAARLADALHTGGATPSGTGDAMADKSVAAILGLAFVAGLILNVMPCVLPVIGLKIMSFVQQAGESRWRIFSLNAWYVLGLMSVFMVLATLAQGWGEMFTNSQFTIVLAAVVFVFALSLLGVWEIPIPGFVGSASTSQIATQEGAVGAFSKGVLTTILATPCAGPFLIPAVAWALGQPKWLTYTTFASIGLGLAAPYLLIGMFPSLIRVLPKPGAWMNTFKQATGFVLMGTVVFIFRSLKVEHLVSSLWLLVGLGLACWWIGRTPLTAGLGAKVRAWVGGIVVAVLAATFAFYSTQHELPWQPFTRVALEEHRRQGKTVLVDFTADW